jgi:carbon monoxide dehydrogenase subunit G
MKVSGSAVLNAPVEQVWAAFNDPAVLARTLPGCQELREVGPDAYKMTITAGVASIKGTYEGDVALTQQNPPGSFVLKAAGAGAPGTVSADVAVNLVDSPSGGTHLTYDADAVVGGVIGGVGQRMLTGVAKKMAGQFFQAVDADIAGVRAPAAAAPGAAAVPTAAGPAVPAPAVPAVAGAAPAVHVPAAPVAAPPPTRDFLVGTLVGAAIALAGVAVGVIAGRR